MLKRRRLPPEKMSRKPKRVPDCCLEQLLQGRVIDARSGDEGAEAVDSEQSQHEQHPFAQVRNAGNVDDRTEKRTFFFWHCFSTVRLTPKI